MSNALTWSLGLDASGFHKELNKASSAVQTGFKGAFKDLLAPIATVAASVGSVAAIMHGMKGGIELGAQMQDLSARTGIAVGDLYMLRKAFKDSGVDAERLGPAVNKMQKALAEAASGGKGASLFAGLGLNAGRLASMDPGKAFEAIGQRINQLPNSTERAAAAMQVFGRAGGELLAVFASPAFQNAGNLSNTAKILGENAAAFKLAHEAMSHVGSKLTGFFVGMSSQFVPMLMPLIEKFEKMDFSGWGQKLGTVIGNFLTDWRSASKVLLDDLSQVVALALTGDSLKLFGLELVKAASKLENALLKVFERPLDMFGALVEKRVNQWHDIFYPGKMSKEEEGTTRKNWMHAQDMRTAAYNSRDWDAHEKWSKMADLLEEKLKSKSKWDTKSIEQIAEDNRKNRLAGSAGYIIDQNNSNLGPVNEEIARLRKTLSENAANLKFKTWTPTALTNNLLEAGRKQAAAELPAPGSQAPFDAGDLGMGHAQIVADSLARVGGGGTSVFLGLGDIQRQQLSAQQQTNTLLGQIVTYYSGRGGGRELAHASP